MADTHALWWQYSFIYNIKVKGSKGCAAQKLSEKKEKVVSLNCLSALKVPETRTKSPRKNVTTTPFSAICPRLNNINNINKKIYARACACAYLKIVDNFFLSFFCASLRRFSAPGPQAMGRFVLDALPAPPHSSPIPSHVPPPAFFLVSPLPRFPAAFPIRPLSLLRLLTLAIYCFFL